MSLLYLKLVKPRVGEFYDLIGSDINPDSLPTLQYILLLLNYLKMKFLLGSCDAGDRLKPALLL